MAPSTREPCRWHRPLTQFSLRSLLVLVTLSAVACWWFLQPPVHDEELAGRRLTLRRQVRIKPRSPAEQKFNSSPNVVSAGSWRLFDEMGGLVSRGTCQDGQPHGHWTLNYPSGRKAAEGRMLRGFRTGLWKVWDEGGRPVSEVTYAIAAAPTPRPPDPKPIYYGSPIPVVGMISPLAAAAPLLPIDSPKAIQALDRPCSIRHGPCRGWHPTGELRFTGQFENDLRTGPWTWFDDQGRPSESGSYVADCREGPWSTADPTSGPPRIVEYMAGRPREDYEQWLAATLADLTSGCVRRELAAVGRLEELGPGGTPLLIELLDRPSRRLRLVALRALTRQSAVPPEALRQVAALTDDPDTRLVLRALLALYQARSGERAKLFPRLLESIDKELDDALAFEALLAIYRADQDRRVPVLAELVDRMGRQLAQSDNPGPWSENVATVADLGWEVVPHLEQVFPSVDASRRWFAVLVLHNLVARGEGKPVEIRPGVVEWRCEIPAAAQPLLTRARADADSRVRETAEAVGKPYYYGGMMNGFSGPGFGAGGTFF